MLKKNIKSITVFAPASSSNLAVGFDILGFPFPELGDEVSLSFNESGEVKVADIISEHSLPKAAIKNTASYALIQMCQALDLKIGIQIKIKKGIPLCSGLGGSAASAVAAVYALNYCLEKPLPLKELAQFAISAESLASGEAHPDNVVPCLWGDFTLVKSMQPLEVISLPMPELYCVLVHPQVEIPTIEARAALAPTITLKQHIQQSAQLAGFISSIYKKDWQQLKRCCQDMIIEPQRAHLLKGFYQVQQAALENGAICCSFSGAGPTLFALATEQAISEQVALAIKNKFATFNMIAQAWSSQMKPVGPKVVNYEIS